jgi:hypothetical protein
MQMMISLFWNGMCDDEKGEHQQHRWGYQNSSVRLRQIIVFVLLVFKIQIHSSTFVTWHHPKTVVLRHVYLKKIRLSSALIFKGKEGWVRTATRAEK